jgi:hypothetical protein
VKPNGWTRISFVANLDAGEFSYYVDGAQVFQHTGASLLDGRHSLYSNADPGHDVRLFNEGDSSGNYTQELYLSSYYFTDRALSASEIAALGAADADGIVAPATSGDFNNDGKVDAADYVIWRNNGGSPAEYSAWRAQFGTGSGTGASGATGFASASAVPEPASLLLITLAVACGVSVRRRSGSA